jgi:hypothetical protein
VDQPIKTPGTGYGRELANLAKLYSDDAKYSGENDNFSFKLTMFNDMCDRADVPSEAKLKAFPTMLKGLALDYYYANVTSSKNAFTFDDVCTSIMSYFEGAEYKRSILNKWNNLTLKSVMGRAENDGKPMDECLQLLIKELRHLQHGLGPALRTDDFIHNKLVNACQEVPACQYACFKPSETLAGLINDLKSSIATYQKAHSTESSFPTESTTLFTDRRYHRNFQPRTNQDRGQRRGYQDRRNQGQGRTEKKCFVCQKEGCWSTKHSRDEREDAKRKFKNRFSGQMNKRIDQYIAEYEGLEDEDDQDTDGELTKEMEALMIDFPSFLSPPDKDENAEAFITTFGPMENPELLTTDLVNRSFSHYLTDFHTGMEVQPLNDQTIDHLQTSLKNGFPTTTVHTGMEDTNPDPFAYVMTPNRYTSEKFYGVMIDSGASAKSTAGYGQYLAFKKNEIDPSVDLDPSRAGAVNVQFGIGSASSIGSLTIDTPFGIVEFHVVKADTPFLLSLADMDRLKVYFNNVTNSLVQMINTNGILRKKGSYPVIRRFGHGFLLWKNSMQAYVNQSFDINPCYLTETELRQLHRRFGHPSTRKLHDLLERSGHDVEKSALEKLSKFCIFCQKHGKSPGRFKFTLRDDVNFNYSVIVDVMYVENSPILHVIDEATRFQAARWLQNISAKHTWDMLRLCWIDVYLGPPDHILHDAGKNFVSREFRQFATSMAITTKAVPVEAHWSIGIVERYHAELRRAYQVIAEDLINAVNGPGNETRISKEIILQMAVKAINDTAGPDGLVPTLLVFGAYPRMHAMDPPAPSISQRAMAIEKAMTEVRKFRAERHVADALNTRNGPIVTPIHDLPLNSDVLVWREGNNQRGKWTGPFKLLGMDGETCKIELPSGPTDFRSTVVKPFLIEPPVEVEPTVDVQPTNDVEPENVQPSDDDNQDPAPEISPRPTRARRLPLRYQNFADITVFLQDEDDSSPIFTLNLSSTSAPTPTFAESRRKEINGLLERQVFELTTISEVPKDVRIFNSRFVDEIKHPGTPQAYEKSRLVVQAYNDHEKTLVLTQAPTIQRMSQRIILAIAASTNHRLYLRDITQAYTQSKSPLNRMFFIRPPPDLNLSDDAILRVIKPLYGVPEAGAHWFNTYHDHHKKNLNMTESTYDPCLLFTNQSVFGLVGMQTDDTLMLGDDRFAELEESELEKAKLMSKKREMLTTSTPIKFNGGVISLTKSESTSKDSYSLDSYSLSLTQPKQFDQIRLVNISAPIDLTGSRGQIRKMVTPKDQYVAQRARGAYIATMTQPEASFDLSLAAQVTNPKEEDAKRLNRRLQWQLDHSTRGLNFVRLKITPSSLKLMVFTDASFANVNLHSQIGYVICLTDDVKANIIHWSSTKCKRVTRSVLAAELYAMAHGFDSGSVVKSTIERILNISLPMILLTDSRSLYDCLVKLGTTTEKRLMVDLMCLRQSYERREIAEIRWIDGNTNPADAMTKVNPCQALTKLIDTNTIDLRTTAWVERMDEGATKNKGETVSSLSSGASV